MGRNASGFVHRNVKMRRLIEMEEIIEQKAVAIILDVIPQDQQDKVKQRAAVLNGERRLHQVLQYLVFIPMESDSQQRMTT